MSFILSIYAPRMILIEAESPIEAQVTSYRKTRSAFTSIGLLTLRRKRCRKTEKLQIWGVKKETQSLRKEQSPIAAHALLLA